MLAQSEDGILAQAPFSTFTLTADLLASSSTVAWTTSRNQSWQEGATPSIATGSAAGNGWPLGRRSRGPLSTPRRAFRAVRHPLAAGAERTAAAAPPQLPQALAEPSRDPGNGMLQICFDRPRVEPQHAIASASEDPVATSSGAAAGLAAASSSVTALVISARARASPVARCAPRHRLPPDARRDAVCTHARPAALRTGGCRPCGSCVTGLDRRADRLTGQGGSGPGPRASAGTLVGRRYGRRPMASSTFSSTYARTAAKSRPHATTRE